MCHWLVCCFLWVAQPWISCDFSNFKLLLLCTTPWRVLHLAVIGSIRASLVTAIETPSLIRSGPDDSYHPTQISRFYSYELPSSNSVDILDVDSSTPSQNKQRVCAIAAINTTQLIIAAKRSFTSTFLVVFFFPTLRRFHQFWTWSCHHDIHN